MDKQGFFWKKLNLLMNLSPHARRAVLSSDRMYRVTLDTDMQIYELSPHQNSFLHKSSDRNSTILELKYTKPQDEFVDNVTNHFPFRITRSSKYAQGIEKLYV